VDEPRINSGLSSFFDHDHDVAVRPTFVSCYTMALSHAKYTDARNSTFNNINVGELCVTMAKADFSLTYLIVIFVTASITRRSGCARQTPTSHDGRFESYRVSSKYQRRYLEFRRRLGERSEMQRAEDIMDPWPCGIRQECVIYDDREYL